MEKLTLSVAVPTGINRHGGDSKSVDDDSDQAGILEFVDGIEAFSDGGLGVDDAGIVSIVVQVNIVIVVIFNPAAVEVEGDDGGNEDDQGHKVVREIHKRLPLLSGFRGRHAIIRGVKSSFAGMILLFGREYKGVDRGFRQRRDSGFRGKKHYGKPAGGNLLSSS
jgi:hypothetical protein